MQRREYPAEQSNLDLGRVEPIERAKRPILPVTVPPAAAPDSPPVGDLPAIRAGRQRGNVAEFSDDVLHTWYVSGPFRVPSSREDRISFVRIAMLFVRALAAFLVLPGVVAGLVPWLIVSSDGRSRAGWLVPGMAVLGLGLCVLLWCVRDFYVAGKGTLAPWDPPKRLVRVGLYRLVRNPMYLGVLMIVSGWALLSGSAALVAYVVVLAVAFHARVTVFEEPWLARSFPDEWRAYAASVSRWMPRMSRKRS